MGIKVISLFSGIGAHEKALKNIGVEFELQNYCEFDKQKSKAYAVLYNEPEEKNLGDITKVEYSKLSESDLVVYSPPCQAFSHAGKKQGLSDEKSRGTLFWNALQVIKATKPKYALMENVDNLTTKFKGTFEEMLKELETVGYNNYWKVIDAADYIPQSRKRVYVVSIRKDVDTDSFEFPNGENTEGWWELIDIADMRELTKRQVKVINAIKQGAREDELPVKIEGAVEFERNVIMLRQSGIRFRSKEQRTFPTLCAAMGEGGGNFPMIAYAGKVGGLTPRGAFRLMGFEYADADKLIANGFKNMAMYKMAGDSVCVPVLEAIYIKLLRQECK